MRPARGFTLVELVVVLGIFAVLSVLAFGGLRSVLSARERVTLSLERTAALQKTYLRLRGDFQQLAERPVRDEFGQERPPVEGGSSALPGTNTVELTRGGWRNPQDRARSTLQRVAYRVNDTQQLVRLGWRTLDRIERPDPAATVLLDKVRRLQLRYLDASGAWHDSWPVPPPAGSVPVAPAAGAPVASAAPRAVEVDLELEDLGDVRWLFTNGRN